MGAIALPTDPAKVEELFLLALRRWRAYSGPRPAEERIVAIAAVLRQAKKGDYDASRQAGQEMSDFEAMVIEKWRGLRGYDTAAMQRRFLALVGTVDARLLRREDFVEVPWHFPTVDEGTGRGPERICPYANSVRGCPHRLMDRHGHHLDRELEENEELRCFARLREWLDAAAKQQRCKLGLHRPITADQARPFQTFFDRPACGGFRTYVAARMHFLVEKVLTRNLLRFHDAQQRFAA
ncbi:unnamed protein product, partial [Phaeothamnion confervicola]